MGLQATTIKDILYSASTYGAAYDTLREMAGFTEHELNDSSLTIEWQKAALLYDLLADLFNNEQIGLTLGREANIAMLGMVGFLMQSCHTVEEAIKVYTEYGYMVCPMVPLHYSVQGDKATLEFRQNPIWKTTFPRNARIGIDYTLAASLSFFKSLTGKTIYPLAAELDFGKCAVDTYKEMFNCIPVFNMPVNRLVFRIEDMLTSVVSSDTSLYTTFNNILAHKKTIFLQQSCSESLKNLLFMQFKGQIPTIEEAADSMNMTVRSLQRKLMEENTSFRAIANDVKKEISLHLMKNANPTEVAEVLGYSDLPAFRRAFKSWTQSTPKEARKRIKEQVSI